MFIRENRKINNKTGEYVSYYSILSKNPLDQSKQVVELSLGRDFDLDKSLWTHVAERIEAILKGRGRLIPISEQVERPAQELARKIRAKRAKRAAQEPKPEKAPDEEAEEVKDKSA
jgi:hypothetical protein